MTTIPLTGKKSWQSDLCEKILKDQINRTHVGSRYVGTVGTTKKQPSTIYLTCPFDPSHKVGQKFYSHHVFKCRDRISPGTEILVCPYNSNHLLLKKEYQSHVQKCPDVGNYAGDLANGMAALAEEIEA